MCPIVYDMTRKAIHKIGGCDEGFIPKFQGHIDA
jgi:hypothetical protein